MLPAITPPVHHLPQARIQLVMMGSRADPTRGETTPVAPFLPVPLASLPPHAGQRIDPGRLHLWGEGLQYLEEHEHVGYFVRPDADCGHPFSFTFDHQVRAQ